MTIWQVAARSTRYARSNGNRILEGIKDLWSAPGCKIGVGVLLSMLLLAILAPILAPYDPQLSLFESGDLARLEHPSFSHPFGTTLYGNDILSQVLVGLRRTMLVGIIAAGMAVLIGVNVGILSGYLGGWVDLILMRLTDLAYALPFLPFAMVMLGVFGRSETLLVLTIALLFWRTTARVVRSQVLGVKERNFIEAAKCSGASPKRILYVHIAPNVVSLAAVYTVLLTAEAIVAEATLSFLGFSSPNSVSLGTVMFQAFSSHHLQEAWWWPIFPGAVIMIIVMSISSLGRAYEELSSRSRTRREESL